MFHILIPVLIGILFMLIFNTDGFEELQAFLLLILYLILMLLVRIFHIFICKFIRVITMCCSYVLFDKTGIRGGM